MRCLFLKQIFFLSGKFITTLFQGLEQKLSMLNSKTVQMNVDSNDVSKAGNLDEDTTNDTTNYLSECKNDNSDLKTTIETNFDNISSSRLIPSNENKHSQSVRDINCENTKDYNASTDAAYAQCDKENRCSLKTSETDNNSYSNEPGAKRKIENYYKRIVELQDTVFKKFRPEDLQLLFVKNCDGGQVCFADLGKTFIRLILIFFYQFIFLSNSNICLICDQ